MQVIFCLALACVLFAYIGYPLVLRLLIALRPTPARAIGQGPTSADIVMAVHNEEASVARRVRELQRMLKSSQMHGRLIVVSDGSTDRTAATVRENAEFGTEVIELAEKCGKASAISLGAKVARSEIIVFADVRQTWAPDALVKLLEPFRDDSVGAVSGDLVLQDAQGIMQGVGLYWRYEKWVRRLESRRSSTVQVSGAISAVRAGLFHGIPAGTILDDVYWPLQVAIQGFRVVHCEEAISFDQLPERAHDEFRRKVRTLSGNFQLLSLLPAALLPWRCRTWFEYLSHKLLRLLVPWALIAIFICSLLGRFHFAHALIALQILFYSLGFVSIVYGKRVKIPLAGAAGSFMMLNAAAWMAFWVWAFGRTGKSWTKTAYKSPIDDG
ncbi:MAG TPA: glycosyltransferase [Tepidisphaeraceae bacterium]|nr:glycosyltransferase [Tepidisphaeraceae bacterium]